MSEFEFSTVLVSIVVAIAITEILATWGRMIRLRRRVKPYWVHVGWMALVLLLAIQFWWSLWELREWPDWNFFQFLFLLMPFLTLVVLAFLMCPDLATADYETAEEYFYRNSSWTFGLASVFIVQLMVVNPVLRGETWLGLPNQIRGAALLSILPLAFSRSRRIHAGVVIACYVLFLFFVAFESIRM